MISKRISSFFRQINVCLRIILGWGMALVLTGCPGSGDDPVKPTPTPTPTPGTDVAVTSVTVSQAKGYLEKNGTLHLEASVKPDNATNKTVTWASSNSAVATVSSTGQVTAKAPGTAQITATAGGKTANCAITVFESATDLSLMDIYGKTITRSTANCYVVSKPGFYKIPMVYGNAIKNGATILMFLLLPELQSWLTSWTTKESASAPETTLKTLG